MPVLLDSLVDDAGLFPPTALAMADALQRHRADRLAEHPMLTDRFLCPLSRWDELVAELRDGDSLDVALIVDTEEGLMGQVAVTDPRVRITHLEVRASARDVGKTARFLAKGGPAVATPPMYFEMPPDRVRERAKAIAGLTGLPRLGVKVRCGGAETGLFPEPAELAGFVATCVAHGVPFKATAGLHHAVRHTDPVTGFAHHGFLNLLVATAVAVRGGGPAEVADALADRDAEAVAAALRAVPAADVIRVREVFTAYGSCSTSEPVADVRRLGLLPDGWER